MANLRQAYLMTGDLEMSRRFYEAGLNLEPRREGSTSISYETSKCELKIQSDFAEDVLRSFNLQSPGERRGEGVILVIEGDEKLERTRQRIEQLPENCGAVITGPRNVHWGDRILLVRDPNGYLFEIRHRGDSP